MNSETKDRIEKIEQGVVPKGYKKTKLGIIPEDWEVKKLGELTIDGGKYGINAAAVEYDPKLPRYLRITDISDDGDFINTNKMSVDDVNYEKFILEKDDIVFARTGNTTGKTYLYKERDGQLVYAGFLIKFSINVGFASSEYVYYHTMTDAYDNWVQVMSARSGQPGINSREYESLEIPVPLIKEQEKIANILSTWDKAIENIEELIKEKEIQKKGLMQQLLTGETRLPGFTGEWEEVKLGKVVTRKKGKAVEQDEDGKYPILGIKALSANKFTEFTNDTRVLAEKNDILLLWDGAAAGSIFTDVEGVVGSTFMRLRSTNINSIFVREYMRKDEEYIQNIREGSGIPHIPRDFLDYYKLNLPPLPEQKAIAQILSTADREIELLNELLTSKKEEKKGLMQLLLTGIVRV